MPRSRGEGTWTQLADKRWCLQISLGLGPDGKRERPRFYGRTQAECREQAEDYRHRLRAGLEPVGEHELIRDYLQRWIDARAHEIRPTTEHGYRINIDSHIIPALGHFEVTELRRSHVITFMGRMRAKGLSPRTVNYAKVVLGAAMQDALRDGVIQQNVVRLVRQLQQPQYEMQPFTAKDLETIRDRIAGTRDEPLITIALAYGLRQGELLGLTWADVSFDLGLVYVRHALSQVGDEYRLTEVKTQTSNRTMVMPDFIAAAFLRQREQQDRDREAAGKGWQTYWPNLVFRGVTGHPLHGPTVTRRFQKMLTDNGIEKRRFHDLRHTCATYLLLAGVELKVIQQILGHATIAVTSATYARVLPKMQEDAFEHMRSVVTPKPSAQSKAQRTRKKVPQLA